MPIPPNHEVGWFEILAFAQSVTPWFILGGVFWRLIDRVVKHYADGRAAEMNKLIDAKTDPLKISIDKLTDAVNKLTYASKP
ncbi:hypothetical protein [Mucilaginibacter sp.]|uniref:hypothetical protein n=1 Tax=Mucilaginibacter sp. TaxID=1882438 RepID=UPI0035634CAC